MRLQNNPFYLLNVSIIADKEAILDAAKEMAFSDESKRFEEAQDILLNPVKRLSAEMGWFPVFDEQLNKLLHKSIRQSIPISTDWFSPLAKLNALVYNFSISPAMKEDEEIHIFFIDENISQDILKINQQFSLLNSDNISETINEYRSVANFPGVSLADVSAEINSIRDFIKQTIVDKICQLDL